MSKVDNVKEVLSHSSYLSDKEIAKEVGCSESLVWQLRNNKYKKATKKAAKAKAIARNTELGQQAKRVGRPPKPKAPLSIVEASTAMMKAVVGIPDFGISFDNSRDKIDVLWHDELYQVDIDELPQTIECIKFLKSKEPNYGMEVYYDGV